jgi:RHS repeat-associated protein
MGYSLPPSLALPSARAHVSPKTHTPLPRLQERGYRYYQPEVGRWCSRDPIKERGGFNLYAFCFNIPLFAIDSLGLNPLLEIGGKCAGSVAIAKIKEVMGKKLAAADFNKLIREQGCPESPRSGSIPLSSYYENFLKTDDVLASFGLCVMDECYRPKCDRKRFPN